MVTARSRPRGRRAGGSPDGPTGSRLSSVDGRHRPSTRPRPCPARPTRGQSTRQPSRRDGAAVPHDRHDRGRAGARRAHPRAARRTPASAGGAWRARSRRADRAGGPVVVTGCGTSEHAALGRRRDPARGGALGDLRGPRHRRARAVAGRRSSCRSTRRRPGWSSASPTRAGRPRRTRRSRRPALPGRATALITVTRPLARRPRCADIVVETDELDQSWCHTVGYLSPLVAAAAVAAHLDRRPVDAGVPVERAGRCSQAGVDRAAIAEAVADGLAGVRADPGRRLRRGPAGRPRARPQDRGGRPGSPPPTATSRRSSTATSPRPTSRPGSS